MTDLFYRAFEDKYRGSRELILSRLQVYVPFVKPLVDFYPDAKALDVGCGRGEWLQIVSELGFDSKGVDLDEGMLEACRELGLQVTQADAIDYIRSLADKSLCIVSGFHIAEHLPFEQLQLLVSEAERVLVPGGVLILETPNPENLSVSTNSFYLDPTHQRPIPPALLGFLPDYYGFSTVKTIRLQEDKALINKAEVSLHDVFSGASPDYAIVAQTQGPSELIDSMAQAFDAEYGLSLGDLLGKWEGRFERIQALSIQSEARAHQAETKAHQAETKAHQAETKAHQAETKAHQAETKAHQAETESHLLHSQLVAMLDSRSWRFTAPMRWFLSQARRLREEGVKSRAKAFSKKILRKLNNELMRSPRLRRVIVVWSRRLGLHALIKSTLVKLYAQPNDMDLSTGYASQRQCGINALSPRAMKIYVDLQDAIERSKRGAL